MDRLGLVTLKQGQSSWVLLGLLVSVVALSGFIALVLISVEKGAILILMGTGLMAVAILMRLRLDALLIAIVFLLPFPIFISTGGRDWGTLSTLSIYLLATLWVASHFFQRTQRLSGETQTLGAVKGPITLLLVAYLLSMINTPGDLLLPALRGLSSVGSSVLLFAMIATGIREERTLLYFVHFLSVSGLIQGAIALWVAFSPDHTGWLQIFAPRDYEIAATTTLEGSRVRTTINDYELLAEYFVLLMPLQVYMVMTGPTLRSRILHGAAGMLGIVGLLLTGTRGAVVALALGLVLFLAIFRPYRVGWRPLAVVATVGLFFYFVSDFIVTNVAFVAPLFDRLLNTQLVDWVPETRVFVWQQILERIPEQLWIGHGPYRVELVGLLDPHSLYLNYLYAVGLAGLIAFVWFIFLVLKRAFQVLRVRAEESICWGLTVAASISVVIFLIDEIKITYLRQSYMQEFCWALFGLIFAGARIINTQKEP
jgi:hypothetical protein